MKLKTFFGPDIPSVMDTIRTEIGENALIVSSARLRDDLVKLVVGLEEETDFSTQPVPPAFPSFKFFPPEWIRYLSKEIPQNSSESAAWYHILSRHFRFEPIEMIQNPKAFLITGPAGSGKTTATVKLTIAAKEHKLTPCVITLDTVKAGANEQLKSLCTVLNVPFFPLKNGQALSQLLSQMREEHHFVLIDSMALRPHNTAEMRLFRDLKKSLPGVDAFLTLPAGTNMIETGETATAFAEAGCTRLIGMRCDDSTYPENILYAAFKGNMALSYFGNSPKITAPLQTATIDQTINLILKGKSHERRFL